VTVYEYEIQVKLRRKATNETEMKTVTEYAYTVADAVMQAAFNNSDNGTFDVTLVRVSPPAKAVELAAKELSDSIARMMKNIRDGGHR
jgi:hypothetical protein